MLSFFGQFMLKIVGLTDTYSLWDFYRPKRYEE